MHMQGLHTEQDRVRGKSVSIWCRGQQLQHIWQQTVIGYAGSGAGSPFQIALWSMYAHPSAAATICSSVCLWGSSASTAWCTSLHTQGRPNVTLQNNLTCICQPVSVALTRTCFRLQMTQAGDSLWAGCDSVPVPRRVNIVVDVMALQVP